MRDWSPSELDAVEAEPRRARRTPAGFQDVDGRPRLAAAAQAQPARGHQGCFALECGQDPGHAAVRSFAPGPCTGVQQYAVEGGRCIRCRACGCCAHPLRSDAEARLRGRGLLPRAQLAVSLPCNTEACRARSRPAVLAPSSHQHPRVQNHAGTHSMPKHSQLRTDKNAACMRKCVSHASLQSLLVAVCTTSLRPQPRALPRAAPRAPAAPSPPRTRCMHMARAPAPPTAYPQPTSCTDP